MADYINLPCAVCGKEFNENDDIVVCPVCGTPHHRECYAQNGGCAHIEWHRENKSYNADEAREQIDDKQRKEEWEKREEERKNAPEIVCKRCGQKNSPESIFCNRCGAPISQGFSSNQNGTNNTNTPFGRVIVNPFFAPQDPNEEIDGIPAWKLSEAVGKNSERIIPQFKFLAKTGRKTSFNVFACILSPFYFFYRKMYALGIITFILEFVLSIPNFILNLGDKALYEQLSQIAGETITGLELSVQQTNFYTNLSFFAGLASLAISVLCGLFANWVYFEKCKKLCTKIDETATSEEDFKVKASKKGGVSYISVVIAVSVYSIICFGVSYLATAFIMNPEMFGL